jgi:hypothetical protein
VDLVRFRSVDIALRRRDWSRSREAVFDRFFAGYRRGLAEPDYRPAQPAIVGRLRTHVPRSHAAFLEWGETQLRPMGEADVKAVWRAVERLIIAHAGGRDRVRVDRVSIEQLTSDSELERECCPRN